METKTETEPNDRRRGFLMSLSWRAAIAATAVIVAVPIAAIPAAATPSVQPTAMVMQQAAQITSGVGRLVQVVNLGKQMATQHIPYVYGGGHGTRPGATGGGYDCSGFVRYLYYRAFGVDFRGGTADNLLHSGRFVRTSHPVPGDLAFFNYEGGSYADHVGVYIGGGQMVNAPHTGANVGIKSFGFGLLGYYHYRGATAADSVSTLPTRTTIAISSTNVRPGQRSIITGSLTVGGLALAGARLYLYQRTRSSSWALGATSVTDSTGKIHIGVTGSSAAHYYQLRMLASSKYQASASSAPLQKINFYLNGIASGLTSRMKANSVAAISGMASRALRGQVIRVQRVTRSGWVATGAATVVQASGAYKVFMRMPAVVGGYVFRLQVSASAYINESLSVNKSVTVVR